MTDYTPTKFSTIQDKAKFEVKLKKFVADGCKEEKFTKVIYSRLSLMFSHIAHYDKHGFYEVWFKNPARRVEWLERTENQNIYGDPSCTWSDVERSIQQWIKDNHTDLAMAVTGMNKTELRFRAGLGEYLRSGGTRCPMCNFDQLEGDSCEIDGGTMRQQVICSSCETTWYDIYRLEGTELIN